MCVATDHVPCVRQPTRHDCLLSHLQVHGFAQLSPSASMVKCFCHFLFLLCLFKCLLRGKEYLPLSDIVGPVSCFVLQVCGSISDPVLLHFGGFRFLLGPSCFTHQMALQAYPQCSPWVSISIFSPAFLFGKLHQLLYFYLSQINMKMTELSSVFHFLWVVSMNKELSSVLLAVLELIAIWSWEEEEVGRGLLEVELKRANAFFYRELMAAWAWILLEIWF